MKTGGSCQYKDYDLQGVITEVNKVQGFVNFKFDLLAPTEVIEQFGKMLGVKAVDVIGKKYGITEKTFRKF